jgi:hypothetical protein
MSDIELVIKIPEDEYNIAKYGQYGNINVDIVRKALANGTPLPKGHKALIDISNIDVIELEDSSHFIRHEKGDDVDVYISASIIIEADREVNNENNNN